MTASSLPIQTVLRDPDLAQDRVTVFFRAFMLIPHFIWLGLWGVGAVVLLPVLWICTLVQGQPPKWLHDFYGAYVRLWVHVYGYGTFVTDKYPPFDGRPGYRLDVEIPPPAPQNRWTILFRLVLALPPLLLAGLLFSGVGDPSADFSSTSDSANVDASSAVGGLLTVIWFLGWFACMARARMAQGMRDLAVYCLGYGAQAWGYVFLLTGRFPDSTPALAAPRPQPDHPVEAKLDDDLRRGRLTVLFRALLFLPHLLWLILWGIVVFFAVVASWFVTLFAGRTPGGLHGFIAAYVRYYAHVIAFVSLAANPFPGFVGAAGSYPLDVTIAPPERQNRWKTGFRLILALPAAALSSAIGTAAFAAAIGAWFFALFMGRVPRGLRDLNAFSVRYTAQYNAYTMLLTDRYAYSGPTLATGPAHRTWLPPEPPADDAYASVQGAFGR